MAEIRFEFKNEQFERAIRQLRGRAPTAIARATNRAALTAATFMRRSVAADLGIKVGVAREAIAIEEASADRLRARIVGRGARIPLIDLGASGPEPSRGRGRGVRARFKGGAGRYPHAFIATMRSGHRGVFQRSTTRRLPIYELRGPSIAHVFDKYSAEGLAKGEEALVKNLAHELWFALQQG